MVSVEFLAPRSLKPRSRELLGALFHALDVEGERVCLTENYTGDSEILFLYGVGAPLCSEAHRAQLAAGGRVVMWDVGYFDRKAFRVSIDSWHPVPLFLDLTPDDPSSRFDRESFLLRDDYDQKGPVILVALGPKSRGYLGAGVDDWEKRKLVELKTRFPGRRVIYRPKPKRAAPCLDCEKDDVSVIQDLLRGASLVVCRHSNVAVDAAIAGVPFECEEGIAAWLQKRAFSFDNRLRFLKKAVWWQWRPSEAKEAWWFIRAMLAMSAEVRSAA